MRFKPIIVLAAMLAAVLLQGCEPQKQPQALERQAILRALDYDRSVAKHVGDGVSLGEALFGASDETKANYVRNLKRVPLDGCPSDFQEAYKRHIAAWDSRNEAQIKATWLDVLSVARLHNVEYSTKP